MVSVKYSMFYNCKPFKSVHEFWKILDFTHTSPSFVSHNIIQASRYAFDQLMIVSIERSSQMRWTRILSSSIPLGASIWTCRFINAQITSIIFKSGLYGGQFAWTSILCATRKAIVWFEKCTVVRCITIPSIL